MTSEDIRFHIPGRDVIVGKIETHHSRVRNMLVDRDKMLSPFF